MNRGTYNEVKINWDLKLGGMNPIFGSHSYYRYLCWGFFLSDWFGKKGLSTYILLARQSQEFSIEILFLGSKWAKKFLREAASHFNPQSNRQEKRRGLQITVKELAATDKNYPDLSLSNGEMGVHHERSLGNHMQTCREYWLNAFISKKFLLSASLNSYLSCTLRCCFGIHNEEMCNVSCPWILPRRSRQV